MTPSRGDDQSRGTNSAFGRIVRGFGISLQHEQKGSEMEALLKGIQAFNQNYFDRNRKLFERLATGQEPSTLFITCSDSRIDPNLLTQTVPGELFVLRNAGNLVPRYNVASASGESATIEYAISVLGIKDVVICGHSDCGAMKAVLEPEKLDGLPAVASWLKHAHLASDGREQAGLDKARLKEQIEQNVLAQGQNLLTHPAASKRVADGELRIHLWVHDIGTGTVSVHDLSRGVFISVEDYEATAVSA